VVTTLPTRGHSNEPSKSKTVDPTFLADLKLASAWNQAKENYENDAWDPLFCRKVVQQYDEYLNQDDTPKILLEPENIVAALKALTKCKVTPTVLAPRILAWEKLWGAKGAKWNDPLTLQLLAANAKAGNIGRVLALLNFRQEFPVHFREFTLCIQSIRAAQFDDKHKQLQDPTRWLDAILWHMNKRGEQLSIKRANTMLRCYTTGYVEENNHYFYRVVRDERKRKVKVKYNPKGPRFYEHPDKRTDPEYSYPLQAAFSFAQSWTYGVAGHPPIEWNPETVAILIQISVHRGAIKKAMQLLYDHSTEQRDPSVRMKKGVMGVKVYNIVLQGLARSGDLLSSQEVYAHMLAHGHVPDAFTVRAIVDGLINVQDLAGAVTAIHDFYYQHDILPAYTIHIKVLEMCLGTGVVHEAKRHAHFLIRQIGDWDEATMSKYHSEAFVKLMRATKANDQLQRKAIEQLFDYFGESLTDDDLL